MSAIFFACCGTVLAADPLVEIEYSCEVPKDLRKDILLHHKDNSTERRDAHAIYKRCHSEGWHGMMAHYARTGNTIFDPFGVQEWGIMTMARGIGISEARTLILKAELVFGEKKLRAALNEKKTDKRTTPSAQGGADQPATAPDSKSQGKEESEPCFGVALPVSCEALLTLSRLEFSR